MPRGKAPAGAGAGHGLDLGEVKKLFDLLIEKEIDEFEMEKNGLRVHVKRGGAVQRPAAAGVPGSVPVASVPLPAGVDPPSPGNVPAPAPPPPAAEPATDESSDGLHIIKSPIVGTYYSSPSPTAPAFVKLGDVVHVGQALCIIEAMKLMNEIESEADGEVARIYVENGQPVEYGQSLFAIKPSRKI
ncbi:MAG TPA: acetyl-CoA carboxylase biotin carboxyl carrier protein [Terriglobia bacterium]|nr:acetyl-CoA carboxylase biotin carboxyl carrier protein [Terriglobia bacterium]